jgi:tripartite-type tricarboxylate transporter receptor subunit TctC
VALRVDRVDVGIGRVELRQHLFENLTGTSFAHIPYKGSGPLATDLLGGQITMSFDTVTPVLPHIKSGKLRALAVTTAKRSSALPDVPTLEEAGLKGFKSAEFKKRMAEIGAEPIGSSTEQMAAKIKNDAEKFAKRVADAKVVIG